MVYYKMTAIYTMKTFQEDDDVPIRVGVCSEYHWKDIILEDTKGIIHIIYRDLYDDTLYEVYYVNRPQIVYLGNKVEFIDNRTKIFVKDMEAIDELSKKIAIKKIMRNKIYYLGLAKKLSMRGCGVPLNQST